MNRRKFIKNISYGGAATITLGGIPVNILAGNAELKKLAAAGDSDNVLIFIQLHGGNDALNMLIPVSQYNEYFNLRENIAIPEASNDPRRYINLDTSVADDKQVGLHPDIANPFKQLYDNGQLAIVQNVGYPDMNLSHFRGRDIAFMGGDATSDYNSGWMGRFLDDTYPGYPDDYPSESMPDPLGIELSGSLSLAYHRENGIPIGLNVGNPQQFYNLISSVGVNPPIAFPDSYAGDELRYIMEFEKQSNQYAERLRDVYDAGSNSSVEYPSTYDLGAPGSAKNNPLSPQLQLIARLLAGGIKTRIFLCRIGGFDTHGNQVESYHPSYGVHAALLYHLAEAVRAFYDDLSNLGIESKVLSMTFTEFGRRAYSNDSLGTDHGTASPVVLFGSGLNGGIYGTNPGLGEDDLRHGNLQYNIDYRQIYTSVVKDWFGASETAMAATGFDEWVSSRLPLIKGVTGIDEFNHLEKINDLNIFPNPAISEVNLNFYLVHKGNVTIYIYNSEGKLIYQKEEYKNFGKNHVIIPLHDMNPGNYFVRIKNSKQIFQGRFIKVK